jgi:hypothetical protein
MPVDATMGDFIDKVYPGLPELQGEVGDNIFAKYLYLSGCVILCSTNDEIDKVNRALVKSMPE